MTENCTFEIHKKKKTIEYISYETCCEANIINNILKGVVLIDPIVASYTFFIYIYTFISTIQ